MYQCECSKTIYCGFLLTPYFYIKTVHVIFFFSPYILIPINTRFIILKMRIEITTRNCMSKSNKKISVCKTLND